MRTSPHSLQYYFVVVVDCVSIQRVSSSSCFGRWLLSNVVVITIVIVVVINITSVNIVSVDLNVVVDNYFDCY